MKRRFFAVVVSTLLLVPLHAGAQQMGARELRKTQRQADNAFAAGQFEQAASLYQQILTSTEPGSKRRSGALYAIALLNISNDPATRDAEAARRQLQELATNFPRFDRRLEVVALRSLLDEIDAGRAEIERRGIELAEKDAALKNRPRQTEARQTSTGGGDEGNPVDDARIKTLQAQLRKALDELAQTRTELTKKEEALEKLKDALVGGPG